MNADTQPTDSGGQETRSVGVGPWQGPLPSGPQASHYDPELLANGDRRNVPDEFRYWTVEAIIAELDKTRHQLHIAIENWEHDFNIGSVVRTANAFNVGGVHIVGRRRWNRRGAMVTDRYLHVMHHETPQALAQWSLEHDYHLFGIDNMPGAQRIENFQLPKRSLLVFGQESTGLTADMRAECGALLEITQYGSTRSMNAGAAAAIAMYTWVLQHADQSTAIQADLGQSNLTD